MNNKTKICTKCKKEKYVSEFGKTKSGKYGVNSVCKECISTKKYEKLKLLKQGLKCCPRCKKILSLDLFYNNKRTKDGVEIYCKKCTHNRTKIWGEQNREWVSKQNKEYYKKNREKFLEKSKIWKKENLKKYPWYNSYRNAKQRCNYKKDRAYKWYGGRGIKFLLTKEDCAKLWERDKGWLLKQPSIDRINNDGDYTSDNCRFIEFEDNRKLHLRG